jgi:hypothetical protein
MTLATTCRMCGRKFKLGRWDDAPSRSSTTPSLCTPCEVLSLPTPSVPIPTATAGADGASFLKAFVSEHFKP